METRSPRRTAQPIPTLESIRASLSPEPVEVEKSVEHETPSKRSSMHFPLFKFAKLLFGGRKNTEAAENESRKDKSKTPERKKSKTPDRHKSKTPDRHKSKTPERKKSKTLEAKSKTPERKKSKTPEAKSKTPERKKSKTPDAKSKTPERKKAKLKTVKGKDNEQTEENISKGKTEKKSVTTLVDDPSLSRLPTGHKNVNTVHHLTQLYESSSESSGKVQTLSTATNEITRGSVLSAIQKLEEKQKQNRDMIDYDDDTAQDTTSNVEFETSEAVSLAHEQPNKDIVTSKNDDQ